MLDCISNPCRLPNVPDTILNGHDSGSAAVVLSLSSPWSASSACTAGLESWSALCFSNFLVCAANTFSSFFFWDLASSILGEQHSHPGCHNGPVQRHAPLAVVCGHAPLIELRVFAHVLALLEHGLRIYPGLLQGLRHSLLICLAMIFDLRW